MRYSTFIAVLLLTMLTLFLGGWFNPLLKSPVATPLIPAIRPAATAPANPPPAPARPLPMENAAITPDAPALEQRLAELEMMAQNNDDDSLRFILLALNDADPEIRAAALNAAIQFGSPEAIPTLQATIAKAEFPPEKPRLQEAIEFLELPPLAVNTTNQP